MDVIWAAVLTATGLFMLLHVVSTYSALGRVIMYTGAMACDQVVEMSDAELMNPQQLHDTILAKTSSAKQSNVDVMRFYRMNHQHRTPASRDLESGGECSSLSDDDRHRD